MFAAERHDQAAACTLHSWGACCGRLAADWHMQCAAAHAPASLRATAHPVARNLAQQHRVAAALQTLCSWLTTAVCHQHQCMC